MLKNKMGRKIINEQETKDLTIQDAIGYGCFTKENLPWFTIDTDKQPKKTSTNKSVVTGKNSKGDTIWLYEMESGKTTGKGVNKNTTKEFTWGCDTQNTSKGNQEKFIDTFTLKNKDYQKEKPSDFELKREFQQVDLSTLSDIFKPGEKFIYKRINTVGTKILQQTPIENALNLAGYTLEEPEITQPEHDEQMDIRDLMGGKYKKYYQPLIDMGSSTIVYPMTKKQKDEQKNKKSGGTETTKIVTDPKELLKLSNTKEYTKSNCRTAIKALYNMKENNTKVDDATLMSLKKMVWGCYEQNTKFNSGAFGVQDELDNLLQNSSKYGLYEFLRNKSRQTNESVDMDMKKIIKENLIKTSEKKQNKLLSENTIIVNRYKLLTENINPKSKKDVKKFFDLVITETAYLHSQDFDQELIKEGFFDMLSGLFGNASSGIFQYFKEHIARWLVTKFGFDPDSWLGNIVIVAVGNLPFSELHNLTNCNFVSKMLAKDIAEASINKIKNDQGLTGPGYDILRNAMVEMVEDSSFGQKIENKISEFICPKLQGLSGKLGDVTQKIKTNALDLGSKAKDLGTKGANLKQSLVS
jgi:hypothetical protein